ncbi:Gldg family protein [Pedobacter sp. MC2016-14]|uniref:Gldg family protein n=1 Tax=Pedobacter sp. MC2016-14 TaxID=2897327 RepID=UPI001E3E4322|nr:Gldg family protein [Pedobacter sp. MC2016-14]MCD0488361.1 Gldg family protein [Pedobacter sp. MC2016-14]
MKTILKIARTELQVMFYSPVAWLILVIFTFQVGMNFTDAFDGAVRLGVMKIPGRDMTINTFGGWMGVFTKVQAYLYLYIPLLTMSIMSRELGSGSIKLLYSSPITNSQIILGKYVSLMVFAAVLTAILSIFAGFAMFTINMVDIPYLLTGLLGLYLLTCAYAAIGLFMSSLTSYNVVAAIGTVTIFALLGYVKEVGQEIGFVRDITYWMAITGRSSTFIAGMITSEDVLYFIIVVGLFLGFTIIKLQSGRVKTSKMVTIGKYTAVFCIAMLLGYFSAKPVMKVYYDATRTKQNTLTKSSQEVMAKLNTGLSIHTYTNMLDPTAYTALPAQYKSDVDNFKQYIRFKPDIKLDYTYYSHHSENPMLERMYPKLDDKKRLDTMIKLNKWKFDIVPYSAISKEVNLEPENYRFVRVLELDNGKKTFLRLFDDMRRLPSEREITAAIKRLVMKLPVIAFVNGHGERGSNAEQDRGYNMIAREKTFRYSLINQGFDFTELTLAQPVPDSIRIMVIAEPKLAYTAVEQGNLNAYIARGGNLIIAGEPGRQAQMNEIAKELGVQFLPGRLVKPSVKFQSDLMIMRPTQEAIDFSPYLKDMRKMESVLTMPAAGALSYTKDKGFEVKTLFRTDSTGSWNELETTNFVDDSVKLNPAKGEVAQSYPTVLALSRKINNREQKVIVTGDADWLSNGELGMQRNGLDAANFTLIVTSFYWLSDGEVPIDMTRDVPPDGSLSIGEKGWAWFSLFFKWGLPAILIAVSLIIWIRRRGR